MTIIPYSPIFKAQCLALFDSNQGKFFDASERADFEKFLESATDRCPYFVMAEGDQALGCGGYALIGEQASLCWGMVERSLHKNGLGTLLLTHRLQLIESKHGKLPVHMETSQHTQDFYKRFGFTVQDVIPDSFGPGLDEVKMVYQP